MEFQGDSATFAAKLKKGVQDILGPLFLEQLKLFYPWQVS